MKRLGLLTLLCAAAIGGVFSVPLLAQDEIDVLIYEVNDPPTLSPAVTIYENAALVGTQSILDLTTTGGKCSNGVGKVVCDFSALGGSGAPTTAQYWTGAPDAGLSAEKDLSGFTGLVLNSAGVPSAYSGGSCTNQFLRSMNAVGAFTCGSVANADLAGSIDLTTKVTGALPVANGGTGLTGGTSGGVPYYSGASTVASSGALAAHGVVVGGGAGAAPVTTAAGTSGQVLTSNGASADPTYQNVPAATFDPTTTMFLYDDFSASTSSATSTCADLSGWTVTNTNSATGTISTQNVGGDANHQGNCEYDTGTTTATAATVLSRGGLTEFWFTGNSTWQAAVWLTALSNSSGGDTYIERIGPCNVRTGAVCTAGAWFEYTHSVNNGNWTINTADGTTATANTSTAAGAAAWHTYKITSNAGATEIHFYIDGSEVANSPITTHIPTTSAHGFGIASVGMTKTGGTGASYGFAVDYWFFKKTGMTR